MPTIKQYLSAANNANRAVNGLAPNSLTPVINPATNAPLTLEDDSHGFYGAAYYVNPDGTGPVIITYGPTGPYTSNYGAHTLLDDAAIKAGQKFAELSRRRGIHATSSRRYAE
jgi:hypothetical protein